MMARFFEFVGNHWELWLAFVVVVVLLLINEWLTKARGGSLLSPQEAVHIINNDEALVIDLRDRDSFRSGHIVGAKHIPHDELVDKLDSLARYKDKPVVLSCTQGQQSTAAAAVLRKHAFENVNILKGGVAAWQADNFLLAKK